MCTKNNSDKNIVPVLLAGGSGTRLWPISRKSFPKQFSKILGDKTLFQQTLLRTMSNIDLNFDSHYVITNERYRFIIGEQLEQLGICSAETLIEPAPKNTAPAILAAALRVFQQNDEAIMLVLPTDHRISDIVEFHKGVEEAYTSAQSGKIVTFGIKPDFPSTAYGYIKSMGLELGVAYDISSFVEKPDFDTATSLMATGEYFWNSGIFMFKARSIVEEFSNRVPDIFQFVEQSLLNSHKDLDFTRLEKSAWDELPDISFDYAIMEKTKNASTVLIDPGWSDLGDWDSVWRETSRDCTNNVSSTNALSVNCENSLLYSDDEKKKLVGIGLKNIISIAMKDAVLVCDKDHAQDVKGIVSMLADAGDYQAENYPIDYRPWGSFESLVLAEGFQVKKITVKPGGSLSLQSHKHRSEHWVVVKGVATVTIGDRRIEVPAGESTYVPVGEVHRLQNMETTNTIVIEVQLGNYLGEDDIIRFDDEYERS
jgi:mannose-1-phosphate guanylyltransferase/mannose-6-phosphate isomerase